MVELGEWRDREFETSRADGKTSGTALYRHEGRPCALNSNTCQQQKLDLIRVLPPNVLLSYYTD